MSKTDVKELVNQALGLQVKHYSNATKSTFSYHMVTDFGKSNTDKSTYRPDLSLVRAYQGSQNKTLLYDFSDGKDNGQVVQTFIRSKGLDITEIDSAEQRITQIIEDKKADDKSKLKDKEERDKFINDLSNSVKKSSDLLENSTNTTE